MLNDFFNRKIVLGSGSPRRAELLKSLGFIFEVRVSDIEESFDETLEYSQIPVQLSIKKALAIPVTEDELLITADTIVHFEGKILNKPQNFEEAFQMISELSGNENQVVTGVTIKFKNQIYSFSEETKVYFRKLDEAEITHYITQCEPFDKAGAYGIQEWIGMIGIEKIDGDYYNVMGLPLQRLWKEIKNLE